MGLDNRAWPSDLGKAVETFRNLGLGAPVHIGRVLRRRLNAWRTARAIANARDLGTKFSLIYKARWWDEQGESASGPGSTLEFTHSFRSDLEAFLRERRISVLLDAPCGDWNWMKELRSPSSMRYIGGDVVPQLVAQLRRQYENRDIRFLVFDITKDKFPEADLWLCRDCLAHLSNADVNKALSNFCTSQIPLALISNYVGQAPNQDIVSGGFRALDLTQPPFCLPTAEFAINDWPNKEGIRHVCLWSRDQVSAAMAIINEATSQPGIAASRN